MRILHLDSSILGPRSISRKLSDQIVQQLLIQYPDAAVSYRDLASDPIPHLSGATFTASLDPGGASDAETAADIALGAEVIDEFLAANTVVIGVPLYNFSIPTQLKAWVDRIVVKDRTFRYTQSGPEGLAGDKRVILAVSRGGFYGPGSATASFEHAETYMRTIFGFIGVEPTIILAEGHAVSDEHRERALGEAGVQIASLA